MLSGDVSFTEALSSLNVGDLLKDFDDKEILKDLDMPQRKSRKSDYEFDIRRNLQSLSKKADTCDRLLESLSSERQRTEQQNKLTTFNEASSLQRELTNLREGQNQLIQLVEKLRLEIFEERRARELMLQEIRSNQTSPLAAAAPKSIPPPLPNPTITAANTFTSPNNPPLESDVKYKELKKKLLLANLRILELQNRKSEK